MHVNRFKYFVGSLAMLVIAGFASSASAQVATGALTGTVTDQKGLAMTGVMVVIHSEDTGTDMQPLTTNESGLYVAPLLPPGTYDVTASQSGFATVQQKGIPVGVATTVRIDVQMPVASTQSLVTVTTEIPVLETEKTEQAQNVSENLVSNLPVSSRRWEQFAFLTPGITPDGTTGGMSFHGINSNYNNNSVDGANNNSSYNASARGGANDGYTYSGDSVREFQVESGAFNAELGQAAGGSVNAITKSGTAALHGDLFYNGRSTPFNAYDPISKAQAASSGTVASQAVRQQNQWGGSVGGPIIKDKLFFFVTDDGYRRVFPLFTNTPQLSPGISAFTCPTIPGGATIPNPAGGTPLTGPAAQNQLNAECAAAKTFATTNVVGAFPRNIRQDIELVKLDYQLNQSNHLSAVANIRDWKQPTSLLSVNGGTAYLQDRFVIATANTVIGNNKVNELRYQYGTDNSFSTLNAKYGTPQTVLASLFTYGQSNGTTHTNEIRNQVSDNFSWTKGTHTIKSGVDINIIEDNARSATNSGGFYTYSSGTLPAGVTCTDPAAATNNGEFCNWLLDITGTTIPADTRPVGQHWTSYAQVVDNVFPTAPKTFTYDFFNDDYAVYVQDTWKARPNLTLNYGVRWDLQALPALQFSSTNVFGANDLPILGYYTDHISNQYGAIQPRFGAAWNLRKTTVVRLGGGIFYGKTVGSAVKTIVSGAGESNINCTAPVTAAQTGCGSPSGGTSTALAYPNLLFNQQDIGPTAANAIFPGSLPGGIVYTTGTLPGSVITIPNTKLGIRAIDPNAVRPRVYEIQAGIEQQLPLSFNLSINYLYTRGVHLPSSEDANIGNNLAPTICSSAAASSCGISMTKTYTTSDTGDTVTLPFYGTGPTGFAFSDRLDARTGPIITQFSDVTSTYNGLVFTVRRPATRGFEILANYTYSKATDNGQAGVGISGENFLSTDGVIDPHNRKYETGPSGTDVRNRFTASVVYSPTFGKNISNMVEKKILDGWQISSTILASNGAHYSALVSTTSQLTNVYCGAPVAGCNNSGFFGTNGALLPSAVTVTGLDGGLTGVDIQTTGNNIGGRAAVFGRDSFVLPNLYNVDVRLTKVTTFKERYSIEFRAEAFNVFNTTLIQAVNGNRYSVTNGTTLTKSSTWQTPSTTSGLLLGPRQLQAGLRFNF